VNSRDMFFLAVKSLVFLLVTVSLCIGLEPLERYVAGYFSEVQNHKPYEEETANVQAAAVSNSNQMYTEMEENAKADEIENDFIQIKKNRVVSSGNCHC